MGPVPGCPSEYGWSRTHRFAGCGRNRWRAGVWRRPGLVSARLRRSTRARCRRRRARLARGGRAPIRLRASGRPRWSRGWRPTGRGACRPWRYSKSCAPGIRGSFGPRSYGRCSGVCVIDGRSTGPSRSPISSKRPSPVAKASSTSRTPPSLASPFSRSPLSICGSSGFCRSAGERTSTWCPARPSRPSSRGCRVPCGRWAASQPSRGMTICRRRRTSRSDRVAAH